MNLQEEIANELATQMQSEIDFRILSDMLVQACGWTKIELFGHHKKEDILSWCEKNIKDHYQHRGPSFVFENQGDAVNFTLKWVN
jgi:hypothetical protein